MNKIRKGDEVIVKTGRDKGQRGTVLEVHSDGRVLVEGVNVYKKHQKGNPNDPTKGQGGIVDKTMPIEHSNVMVFNPKTKKGERIHFRIDEDGSKVRVFQSGDDVDI